MEILDRPTRFIFFTGKGGVGKTSLACATAVQLADAGKRVLLVSTDPASNLDQVLGTPLGQQPTPVAGVPRLDGMNIDPEAAAEAYRNRAIAPLVGVATAEDIAATRESLSGACTVEIAAFDEFTSLLVPSPDNDRFDHIVFDTAPTGHTLRLLSLPAAWATYIEVNPAGATCLGPSSALGGQRAQYIAAVEALKDPRQTTLVLVARPDRASLAEADRTAAELAAMGVANAALVINGVFTATDRTDGTAVALEARGRDALREIPETLARLPQRRNPLRPFNVVGIDRVRAFLADQVVADIPSSVVATLPDLPSLGDLVDDLGQPGHGLVMVMGKGGVGKTTIASAIAVELARRGHPVHLTTTDPAAHLAATVEDAIPGLEVSRIDPAEATRAYRDRVLASRRRGLTEEEAALVEEDMASPCTEEVAVFHAFSRTLSKARTGFVVIDTAPTGHTLLLLDTTGAYHHEILASMEKSAGLAGAVTPLMKLRDPAQTRMVLVTLPETTPVAEATQLQDDLRRAGIEPYAWVINSSLAATEPTDPLLRARAAAEAPLVERITGDLASRVALVGWAESEPVGVERLAALARRRDPALHG